MKPGDKHVEIMFIDFVHEYEVCLLIYGVREQSTEENI
jgi:hypothetical protein